MKKLISFEVVHHWNPLCSGWVNIGFRLTGVRLLFRRIAVPTGRVFVLVTIPLWFDITRYDICSDEQRTGKAALRAGFSGARLIWRLFVP